MPIGDWDWGCNTLQFRQMRRVAVGGNAVRAQERPANFYRDVAIRPPCLNRVYCARLTYSIFTLLRPSSQNPSTFAVFADTSINRGARCTPNV
jgi:hypothetical protein